MESDYGVGRLERTFVVVCELTSWIKRGEEKGKTRQEDEQGTKKGRDGGEFNCTDTKKRERERKETNQTFFSFCNVVDYSF